MSAAYYVVLENPNPGFNTLVQGAALAKAASNIDRIARMLGIKILEDFVNADLTEFFDDDEEDIHNTVADVHKVWFDASEGLEWATQLAEYIENNPSDVHDAEAVQDDLAEYQELFRNASKSGIRWHLEVDY
ncbi:MAG: hypothetical protein OER80_07470 [Gammaproteobacteria bacterium]|nr:hypothetical protein [Gammaproteobacteria bacterium]MDH3768650.1 hypothetical protein [Gammaproteobacteria bacterium]